MEQIGVVEMLWIFAGEMPISNLNQDIGYALVFCTHCQQILIYNFNYVKTASFKTLYLGVYACMHACVCVCFIHSFHSLSYDRHIASSKASSRNSVI